MAASFGRGMKRASVRVSAGAVNRIADNGLPLRLSSPSRVYDELSGRGQCKLSLPDRSVAAYNPVALSMRVR